MSTTTQETPYEIKSADFIASGAYKSAPLGGINEFSVDTSIFHNVPDGPDGKPMVCMWGYPQTAPEKALQGVRPIPESAFRRGVKGGMPMGASSPSILFKSGGVFKEGGIVQAFWTTHTNYQRIQRNRDEAAQRCKGGKGLFAAQTSAEDREMARAGITPLEKETFQDLAEVLDRDEFAHKGKTSRIVMSGKKDLDV